MPLYHRFYCPGELQFLTTSTYCRIPVFRSERFRRCFVQRLNVFSEKKFQEKLDYMHNHPVVRGRVSSPADWPWSSWRFDYLEDASILRLDRLR